MAQNTCTICGGKIPLGTIHVCAGKDRQAPVLVDILSELKRIGDLLEDKQAARQPAPGTAQTKAHMREKR
jgi:hypothetical protein